MFRSIFFCSSPILKTLKKSWGVLQEKTKKLDSRQNQILLSEVVMAHDDLSAIDDACEVLSMQLWFDYQPRFSHVYLITTVFDQDICEPCHLAIFQWMKVIFVLDSCVSRFIFANSSFSNLNAFINSDKGFREEHYIVFISDVYDLRCDAIVE